MSAHAPRMSVVMPYLRAHGTIERAIRSVLSQSMADFELIAVSDGSQDGSVDIVADFARRDPRVRSIELDRNHGPSFARNRALDAARGAWIAVLDADDAFAAGRLAALLAAATDDVNVVCDNLTGVDPLDGSSTGALYPALPATLDAVDILAKSVVGSPYDYGYLKPMFRREFLHTHGLRYDETLRTAEDLLLLLECVLLGGPIRTVDDVGYAYTLQYSTKRRMLSTTTHSAPMDLEIAGSLRTLMSRRAAAIDDRTRAAFDERCAFLHRIADVSRFRHAVYRHRFGDALGLFVRSSPVRAHVWQKFARGTRS